MQRWKQIRCAVMLSILARFGCCEQGVLAELINVVGDKIAAKAGGAARCPFMANLMKHVVKLPIRLVCGCSHAHCKGVISFGYKWKQQNQRRDEQTASKKLIAVCMISALEHGPTCLYSTQLHALSKTMFSVKTNALLY